MNRILAFIGLLFAVLAIGARFSDDERIFHSFGYLSVPGADLEDNPIYTNVPAESAGYAFIMANTVSFSVSSTHSL